MNFQQMRQTGEAQFYASEDLCPPSDTDTFSAKNIRKCQREVRAIQRRLDTAVANGDKANIRRHFDHLAKRSNAVRILAVNQVTRVNPGKWTAGVDGIALPKGNRDKQNHWRMQ